MNGNYLSEILLWILSDQEKVSDYEMKLMDLDVEQLGIPVSVNISDTESFPGLNLNKSETKVNWEHALVWQGLLSVEMMLTTLLGCLGKSLTL